jgi:hypothetical protein
VGINRAATRWDYRLLGLCISSACLPLRERAEVGVVRERIHFLRINCRSRIVLEIKNDTQAAFDLYDLMRLLMVECVASQAQTLSNLSSYLPGRL